MSEEDNEETFDDNEDVFQPGESVLITKMEDDLAIGLWVGIMDFGVIVKGTHRTEKIKDQFSVAFKNDFKTALWKKTVAELRELGAEEEISLVGLRKKDEIILEISDVMLARGEEQLEERDEFVTLKRPVLTFLPWPEVREIRRLSEFMEEQELQEFSYSLDAFAGIDVGGSDMGPGHSKVSDE